MPSRQRVTLWVFVKGRAETGGRGAAVAVVEARRTARAEQGGSGGYWWAEFTGLSPGAYTVRVRFAHGLIQERRVIVEDGRDQVRFNEDEHGPSSG